MNLHSAVKVNRPLRGRCQLLAAQPPLFSTAEFGLRVRRAFTLVELLISMSVLALIMFVLLSIINSTQRIWKQTSARIDSFRAARIGFESVARRMSQATLNTYWDYDNPANPNRYVRRSELRFVSGGSNLAGGLVAGGTAATHSAFFQAPLGFVSDSTFNRMETMMNTFGYYVVLSSDAATRPLFLTMPARTRFRLMELSEPAESLSIYAYTSGSAGYNGNQWYMKPLSYTATDAATGTTIYPYSHVVADNVIALVLLPKLSAQEDPTGTTLAPGYVYTSAPQGSPSWPPSNPQPVSQNQLPPLVQVTMVAIDEASAARLESMAADQAQTLGLSTLFQTTGSLTDATVNGYARDLKSLTDKLQSLKLNYRVFNSEVAIRGAKWSKY